MAESEEPAVRSSAEAEYCAFVEENWVRFLRLARLLTGDEHRGEELLQDCLVKLYIHWSKANAKGDPAAYLRRMLVNGHTDWWRRHRRELLVEALPDRPAPAPADGALEDSLRAALRALPKGQRAVMVLRYCEDLSERETAAVLGCSIGTVKSQNARAMTSLRSRLAGIETETETDERSLAT